MSDIAERIAKLTPAQRALLQHRVSEATAGSTQAAPIARWESDRRDASFGQERLWFLDQLDGSSPLYNIAVAIRLRGLLEVRALRCALDAVIRRHETLRTRYIPDSGVLRIDVTDDYAFELPISESEGGDALEAALEDEARKPLVLARDLLLRARLFRVADDDHTLLVTMHHIASDGWSLGVFYRDLAELYNAAVDGTDPVLPELQIQYSDYAHWMREPLQSEALESLVSRYVEKLRAAPMVLELPSDRPRPARQTFAGRRRHFALSGEESTAIRELCQREGVTPFMAWLAALYAVLHRYSGESQILVGSPIAGRTRAETGNLIGFFTNTIVLPGDLSGDPDFLTLLRRTRDAALDAYAHQDVPFEQVTQRLSNGRDLSRSPVFQVMLVLDSESDFGLDLRGLETSVRAIHTGTSKFELSVHVKDAAAGVDVSIDYNTDVFDDATIERFWQHLHNLMHAAVVNPALRVSRIPLLSAAERHAMLHEWNATARDYPGSSLTAIIEERVRQSPGATAVVHGERSVSYGQLNERANQLARELIKHGAAPGELVGLCVERGIEMMIGLLGIVKAGAGYIPLDPSLPAAQMRHALDDSNARLLVTNGGVSLNAASFEGTVVDLRSDEWISNESSDVGVETPEDSPAYVIYTSGSTAKPKGVLVTHHSLLNLLWAAKEQFRLSENDRVLAVAPISFDIAGADVWLPWMVGATTVVARTEQGMDGEQLRALIERHDITFMQATPVTWRLLLETGWNAKANFQCASSGDVLTPDLAASLCRQVRRVWNMYGPTETTIWSTGMLISGERVSVAIGRPIANTQCYILDALGEPQPVGVIGELYIGGDGVARGYVNQPDLTREKFVANPYSTDAGARMYRTGDMVRYRADGSIEFIGRTDHQVKIRGYRIELGAVESSLMGHPRVKRAVVMAREDTPGDRYLAAYVVPNGEPPSPAELRSLLKRDLPEYMIPSAYVMLEAIPVTAAGKVDRKLLPAPGRRATGSGSLEGARTPTEALVAAIWEEVLKIGDIGIGDDFFEIGGHSLKAMQVITRLRAAGDPDIPIRLLFECPTIESLAVALDERRGAQQHPGPARTPSQTERKIAHLSFSQEQLWLVEQLEPGNTAYIIGCTLKLSDVLDVAAVQDALAEIVRRHAILRTAFVMRDGSPIQIVKPAQAVVISVTDLSKLPESSRAERMRAIEDGRNRKPFDLTAGDPVRFELVTLGPNDHRLLVTAHHIAIDGWSLQILVREFSELYSAFRRGESSPLQDIAMQYADFAAWQREEAKDGALDTSLDYWRDQLADAPALLQLPLDHPRPPVRTFSGASESGYVDEELGHAIAALGQHEGATIFMALAAAFQLLLARMTGESDVIIGMPVAGRTRVEAETMLGCFINTLPLRTRIIGDGSFRDLLRDVRANALDAYAHQAVPFDMLVEELNPERNLTHAPIFQVLLNVLNMPDGGGASSGVSVERRVSSTEHSKFDLTLYVEERAEGLHLGLVYSTDLFTAERAAAMLGQLTHLLRQVVSDPDAPVNSYSLVSPTQATMLPDARMQLSRHWEGSVAEIFSTLATRAPERAAVIGGSTTWSYRELDERSNQLAHYLAELGARRGEVVAIYAERSGALALALLSVLKTGAAFVVLDRGYPASRLLDYVAEAHARVIIRLAEAGELPEVLRRYVDHTAGISICEVPNFADADNAHWSSHATTPLDRRVGPDDTAYIAFTSGTTGRPKGILGRHGSLTHFTPWLAATFGLDAEDRYSLLSGLAHDPLHRDVFTPLQIGACICVPEADAIYDPERLAAWMRDAGVTIAHLTPALGQLVASSVTLTLPQLRIAFFVGDALTRRDVERLEAIAPAVTVVNYYGTTETQRAVSFHVVHRGDESSGDVRPREIVPLGRGIPDVQLLVVTPRGNLAGVGEPGEIVVRSPHIAIGYLNDAALTSERFVPNPITGDPLDVCYRTGDRGSYDAAGDVIALGRADTQVKIRGFRVEPAEIEAVLGKHSSVKESIVTAYPNAAGELGLAAYVVPRGSVVDPDELRAYLKARLPGYMMLSSLTVMQALPLTPNGKVDRRALPVPSVAEVEKATKGVPPRNPVHDELHDLWAELLGVSPIGMTDDFFDLGGHSLLAVSMMERVAQLFEVRLPLSVLFEEPTIRHLTDALIAKAGLVDADAMCVQRGDAGRVPLFLFHGDYMGGGLYCRKLVRYLDAGQPVYVIAPHMPGAGRNSVEDMAADALPHMRQIQASGPYMVAGYCNGGMVALEVARQLRAAGAEVAFLAVIDIGAKNVQLRRLYGTVKRVTTKLGVDNQRQLDLLVRMNEPALRFIRDDLPPVDGSSGPAARAVFAGALSALVLRRAARRGWRAVLKAAGVHKPAKQSWEKPEGDVPADERLRRARSDHITRALRSYVPGAYDGTITLIAAESGRIGKDESQLRHWRSVGRINVITIPCDHSGVVTSHIAELGAALGEHMPRTQ